MRAFVKFVFAALVALVPLKADAKSYTALYRGVVVSSVDPSDRHRIQVRVPDLTGPTLAWAAPCMPYNGDMGPDFVPPPGSSVWILFERGDIHYPVWIGWIPGSAPERGDPIAAPPSGQ